MKSYDVKIEQDSEKNRSFIVKVECEEDFIEWYNILSFFEKEKNKWLVWLSAFTTIFIQRSVTT